MLDATGTPTTPDKQHVRLVVGRGGGPAGPSEVLRCTAWIPNPTGKAIFFHADFGNTVCDIGPGTDTGVWHQVITPKGKAMLVCRDAGEGGNGRA